MCAECAACGPALELRNADGAPLPGDALEGAIHAIADGMIVAGKGIGGCHLAADACNAPAVSRLRARKHREDKPFAIMVRDLDSERAPARVGRTFDSVAALSDS